MLTGSTPRVYVACSLTNFDWTEKWTRRGKPLTADMVESRRNLARREAVEHWQERLSHARVG